MLRNMVPARPSVMISYRRGFDLDDNSGFSFPCDKDGNILAADMNADAMANYKD